MGNRPTGPCRKWYAWHDYTAGAPATLYVAGECLFETPGFTLALARSPVQGVNPEVLVLRKTVSPPAGDMPRVQTPHAVTYDERTTAAYTHVHIQPDEVLIDVVVNS